MIHPKTTDSEQCPLWTALVTPFTKEAKIDFESLQRLLHEQIDAQNGILLLGSTGEALNMSESEKKSLLEFSLKIIDAKVPVMVGLMGFEEEANLRWLNDLENLRVDAYLAITPIYAKPGRFGQTHWFTQILNASTKPVMLYNVPSRSGVKLNSKTVEDLSSHKNFWAIKEASGSVDDMKTYLHACKSQKIYCGDDGLMPLFCSAGSVGLVSVASNAWPKATHLYAQKSKSGSLSEKDQTQWALASDSLFEASNPIPVKMLLNLENRISTNQMKSPLSEKDLAETSGLIKASQFVNSWYKENS